MVVAGIVAIISAVIFSSQSSFSNSVLVTNTAYDVALTARDAETYGLGTRAAGAIANAGYGLHFAAATPKSYIFFADTSPAPSSSNCHGLPTQGASAPNAYPGDCVYTAGSDYLVTTYTLGNQMTIGNFCETASGATHCSVMCNGVGGCTTDISTLDIVYIRPNATPFMSKDGTYNSGSNSCVAVYSPTGQTIKYVAFSSTGQINVNATSCP